MYVTCMKKLLNSSNCVFTRYIFPLIMILKLYQFSKNVSAPGRQIFFKSLIKQANFQMKSYFQNNATTCSNFHHKNMTSNFSIIKTYREKIFSKTLIIQKQLLSKLFLKTFHLVKKILIQPVAAASEARPAEAGKTLFLQRLHKKSFVQKFFCTKVFREVDKNYLLRLSCKK